MPSRPIAVIVPLNLVNLLSPIHACHLTDVFHSDHPNYSFHRIRLSRPIDRIHAFHLEHSIDGLGLWPSQSTYFPRNVAPAMPAAASRRTRGSVRSLLWELQGIDVLRVFARDQLIDVLHSNHCNH